MSSSDNSSDVANSNVALDAALDAVLSTGDLQCVLKNTFLHFYNPGEVLGDDRRRLIRQTSDLQHTRDINSRRHIESLSPLVCTLADAKGNLSSDQLTTDVPNSTLSLDLSAASLSEGEEGPPAASIGAYESIGSAGHMTGDCKACAWWWKPGGCFKGRTCEYCHACDELAFHLLKSHRRRQQRISD